MKPLLVALVFCGSAFGQDLSIFSSLRWRNIGPLRGGRSVAVAGSAARPLEYYFGATGGGLWKTTDGGTSWNPVSDAFFQTSSVGAVAVAPSNPDIVYVGMGETELRGNIIQGDGIYKSIDGGKTWKYAGLEKSMAIARIRVDRSDPNLVYVAAFGDPYGQNPERGVFRSTDGGQNWQKILYRDEKTGAIDLAIDPNDPRVLYASLWEAFRTSYSLSSGGPGSGFFKSTDGGDHWKNHDRGFGRSQPPLRAHRGAGWRVVPLRRRRRYLEPGQQRAQSVAAGVLFSPRICRPGRARHGLCFELRAEPLDRRWTHV
jgi:photosystem II stability/assembly factor-like uncharacterized protein